jgi:ATP-dependent Lon protease
MVKNMMLDIDRKEFDEKIVRVFGDVSIHKKRLPSTKLDKKGIPGFVAEWAIDTIVPGTGELSKAEIQRITDWTEKYIPVPKDSEFIKHRLLAGETIKILSPLEVRVIIDKRYKGVNISGRFGSLKLLNLNMIFMPDELVDQYPELLNEGMWGVVELRLLNNEYTLLSFKPMQASVNIKVFKEARKEFTLKEWLNLMIVSMGYDPFLLSEEEKLIYLCRLLPLVQKNMHLIELAPKGTGKSYFYENISPKVRIVSGGTISPAVLFVNNATDEWGLLARYKALILDEIQTAKFEKPGEIIGTLKGFLANSKLTRGGKHETSSDCSLIMLANIELDSDQKPVKELYFEELPEFLRETAFIDRLKGVVPGWQTRKLDENSFAKGVGLKTDFFGDTLIKLRDDLEIDQICAQKIQVTGRGYKRNSDAVQSIASGMMKILFPDGNVSDEDFDYYCVRIGKKLRQEVWSQLYILDGEYRQYDEKINCQVI